MFKVISISGLHIMVTRMSRNMVRMYRCIIYAIMMINSKHNSGGPTLYPHGNIVGI